MRLRLKPGYRYEPNCVVSDGRAVVIHSPESKTVTIMLGFAASQKHDVVDDVSWLKTAHLAFEAAEWESPWVNVATAEELTAAAEGEGPVVDPVQPWKIDPETMVQKAVMFTPRKPEAPPAPRLCAVDRLEAAGYALHVNDEFRRLHIMRPNSLTVFAANLLNTGRWTAWIDGGPKTVCVYAIGDESPGLNAALESLLSKPVGAVTVAQILGVA